MSINFDRNRTQKAYERIVGIFSPEELSLKADDFKSHVLTKGEVSVLKSFLNDDALDYFYNGIISFSEGIDSIFLKRFSWATIKLYYSVYYMIRASLACRGHALLQFNGMYRLHLKENELPYKTRNKKYNATHGGTISHYIDLFSNDDKLLSNTIDTKISYEWLQDAREIVNYRAVSFQEPMWLDIWDKFAEALDGGNLNELLLKIQDDGDYIYCFQEEYAVVGVPIKRVSITIKDFIDYGLLNKFDLSKRFYTKQLVKYDERNMNILNEFFDTTAI
ncbi:hypothetical protein [Clostridium sp. DJ247]|uniref:hypothetical protein n=1 Tax=Clostridium sp. DJ247 TaxID=2726188 RepID=UPI001629FC55|nr:hypothetical protein [Clostridium sp. DJ247]MBC2579381.1 hypothetical protein [Clostridium sp. DJ247]